MAGHLFLSIKFVKLHKSRFYRVFVFLERRCVQAIKANYTQGGLLWSACSFGAKVIRIIRTTIYHILHIYIVFLFDLLW